MSMKKTIESTQYLSFHLDEEEYALEIFRVREVLDYTRLTRVPQMPGFMKGVINLRGAVVPVVDLKDKFSINATEKTVQTRIIICEVWIENEISVIGVMADSVHEVMEIDPSAVEPAPKIGTRLNTDFLKGLGKRNDDFIMILDIDTVFSATELSLVTLAGQTFTPGESSFNASRQLLV